MTTADLHFYGRMLGSPIPATFTAQQAEAWVGAALKNPEKRVAAHARMDMLIASLPTEEDAARTPTDPDPEPPKHIRHTPMSMCACDSGKVFADCHGAA